MAPSMGGEQPKATAGLLCRCFLCLLFRSASDAVAGEEFGQEEFEEAVLLGEGESVDLLQRARGLEQAYARRSGGFSTGQEGSRFTQRGRTRY